MSKDKIISQRRKIKSCLIVSILATLFIVSCCCVSDEDEEQEYISSNFTSSFSSPCEISVDLFDFKLEPSKTSNPSTFLYDLTAKGDISEFKFHLYTFDKGEGRSFCRISEEKIISGKEKGEKISDKIELPIVSVFPGEIYNIYVSVEATPFKGKKIEEYWGCSLSIEGDISDLYNMSEWKHYPPISTEDSSATEERPTIEILEGDECIGRLEWWINKNRIKENQELKIFCKAETLSYHSEIEHVVLYIALFESEEFSIDNLVEYKAFALGWGYKSIRIAKFSTSRLVAGKKYFACIAYSCRKDSLEYDEEAEIIGEYEEICVFSE